MALQLGDTAPDFTATTTEGSIRFHEWLGQDVIIVPSVSNDDARKLFPEGWKEYRPYLRVVKQPN